MKKILSLGFLLLSFGLLAQTVQPAKWSWKLIPAQPAIGTEATLVFNVKIEPDWYLYSSDFDPDLGPIVTTVDLSESKGIQLLGKLQAIKPKSKFDKEIWGGTYTYFEKQGEFRQKIKITQAQVQILGAYDSQACSSVTGLCVPVKGRIALDFVASGTPVELASSSTASKSGAEPSSMGDTAKSSKSTTSNTSSSPSPPLNASASEEEGSLWAFFWVAMGAGFLALLTPCVYPLIPMTVSFFTKQQGGKRLAFLYGAFIVLIYLIFGTALAFFAGASFANFLSTHWIPNLLFFAIFVLFGISFLGAFEIVLPASLVNRIDAKSDKGGLVGVFFMAFTLVLVSFSCTGPLAGSILIAAAQGVFLKPIVGMLGFSLAFAIPFTLFATFPGFLQRMPRSGNWMNEVKVVLGFLELALAFKFLSTADQVYHWHLLDREVFLAIWIALFAAISLYLFGKIRLPHDGPSSALSIPRVLLGTSALAFTLYMIPGMFGAPLKALSGWLPPISTQDFNLSATQALPEEKASTKAKKHSDFLRLPYNIPGYFDFKEAQAAAKEAKKPIFIDFTGHGCVNCRKMEEYVWSDPRVLAKLKKDFVVVALYVDDKTELPEKEWYLSKVDGQWKKTIGDQNLDFEIGQFNANAQPNYIILDPQSSSLKPLVPSMAFEPNVDRFLAFLDAGLKAYTP